MKKKKRKYHFKVVAQETPLFDNVHLGTAKVKFLGDDSKLANLLLYAMQDSKRGHKVVTWALRRYARKHPEWWSTFKAVTDMQLSDPPRS